MHVLSSQAGLSSVAEVDGIAVTRGPGREMCLRVGYEAAKTLAASLGKPFVTVHHLEAHWLVARLPPTVPATAALAPASAVPSPVSLPVSFPFLALVVSGGHTCVVHCRELGQYTFLGVRRDETRRESTAGL